MTPEDKLAKAKQISEAIIRTAEAISSLMKQCPAAKRGRRITRNFKRKKALIRVQIAMSTIMGASNVARIVSQPVSKYPSGGVIQNGMAIAGENGKEEIIKYEMPGKEKVQQPNGGHSVLPQAHGKGLDDKTIRLSMPTVRILAQRDKQS